MKRHRKWKVVLLCSFHGFNIRLSFVGTQIAAFNRKYYWVWNFCHVKKLALYARNIAISYNLSLNFRNLQKVRNNFALFYICVYAPSKNHQVIVVCCISSTWNAFIAGEGPQLGAYGIWTETGLYLVIPAMTLEGLSCWWFFFCPIGMTITTSKGFNANTYR